jgi:hypothetical protein
LDRNRWPLWIGIGGRNASEYATWGEALDGFNFIEEDQGEDSSDSRDGSDAEVGIWIMSFGDQGDFMFQTGKELIIIVQKFEVKFNVLSDAFIGESFSHPLSICFIGDFLFNVWEVVLVVGILDMGQKFSSFSGQMHSSTEEVSGGPHPGRIDIGLREHPSSE